MKRFLTLFFLITIFTQIGLVAQSFKKSSIREITFIDLRDSANTPFWEQRREIPRLIMAAIENGSIKSLNIDYQNLTEVVPLTDRTYKERLDFFWGMEIKPPARCNNCPGIYVENLHSGNFPYLGLDQTVSIVGGKEYVRVNYVNFYSDEHFSEDRKTKQYRFSVTWEDFITVLKKRNDLLYTPNIYATWWRGDVFITNEHYLLETTTSDFIEQSQLYGIAPKDFRNLKVMQTIDSLNKKNYDPFMMDLYIIDEQQQSVWKNKRLAFGTIPKESYNNERRFVFEWKDFLTVLEDKESAASKDIYTLADAFLLQKFKYADTIQSIPISENGEFRKGGKDGLCVSSLNTSFHKDLSGIANTKFHTEFLESIYLGDTSNAHLNHPGHGLAELLYGYVLNEKLVAYKYDSLGTPMTLNEFKYNASSCLDVTEIFEGSVYNKDDTISINVYLGHRTYEMRYFIVQERFIGRNIYADSSLFTKLKRYYPPLIPVEELSVVECIQHLTFDQEGRNKRYKLEVLALHVSADGPSNIKGVQYPICYVRWEDLKAVLLNDPRALFTYKGDQIRLVHIIENRKYLSTFLKTGFVEIK